MSPLTHTVHLIDASLDWDSLRWPLQGARTQAQSPKGRLELSGSPDDYAYTLASYNFV